MNIEEEITKYYNDRYDKYKKDIIDILCGFLGEENRELITTKVNSLGIVYFVNRKGLKRCLNNDELESNERKLLECFLDKMDVAEEINIDDMNTEELIKYAESLNKSTIIDLISLIKIAEIGCDLYKDITKLKDKLKELIEKLKELCKKSTQTGPDYHVVGAYNETGEGIFGYNYCQLKIRNNEGVIALPIYNEDFSPDSHYLWAALNYIIEFIKKEEIDLKHNLGNKLNTHITDYFSILLAHKLHQKGTYIFDNKHLTKNEDKYAKLIDSEVYQKIKLYFGHLFLKFLTEPNTVMELVGKENFRKFALWIVYLAPSLSDEYYEEEEYKEDENAVEIPYEELDIDIMEVLDDMYLEYLRHQDISLTTIDFKKIINAKNTIDAKLEYEREEKAKDSKFYRLTLLFKYLEQYGNCQIRFYSYGKTCDIAEFIIDESGKLRVFKKIEVYDRCPFNSDRSINSKAKLKETLKVCEYDEKEFDVPISSILYYSLYPELDISTDRSKSPINKKDISKLYNVAFPMFNLSSKDIVRWVLSSDTGNMNILLRQKKAQDEVDTPENIELKMQTLNKKINEVYTVWRRVNNAKNEEEYQKASKEWLALERKAYRK